MYKIFFWIFLLYVLLFINNVFFIYILKYYVDMCLRLKLSVKFDFVILENLYFVFFCLIFFKF